MVRRVRPFGYNFRKVSEMGNKRVDLSCSTMVAVGSATRNGDTIFGKNSDRPVNEAQPLAFYPAQDHPVGSKVRCTYISVPQVRHTYGCIGSRPYNIFGFEHGVNECGVMIGNEAVPARVAPELRWGLLGMDILRLALERSDSAAKAVEVIGSLLETYGTGGDPEIRPQYFNANYIIADAREAYLFESCQRDWAAKKVDGVGNICNCYSLGDDYDLIGKNVVENAVKNHWSAPKEKINIAQAFSQTDGNTDWSDGYFRYTRQHKLMYGREPFTVKMMMENLRDHYAGKIQECLPYSVANGKAPTVCCHAGGIAGCTTAASVVCSLDAKAPDPFRFIYWGSMAPPCGSVFRPNFNINWIPEDLSNAGEMYDSDSQWWTFIELERYLALNYGSFAPKVREGFDRLEDEFIERVQTMKKEYDGNTEKLKEFCLSANRASFSMAKDFLKEIKSKINPGIMDYALIDYVKASADGCGMELAPALKNI